MLQNACCQIFFFFYRLLDISELKWQIHRVSPTPTATDGLAQLITLLPDLASGTNWGFRSGQVLLAAAGSAEFQQAVITAFEFLKRVVGSGMYEAARDRVFQYWQQQQQPGSVAAAATAAAAAGGVGSVGRLCLVGLLMPEKLGFTAAEGGLNEPINRQSFVMCHDRKNSSGVLLTALSMLYPEACSHMRITNQLTNENCNTPM